MAAKSFPIDDIASTAIPLLARTPDDPQLKQFLSALGALPLRPFPANETDVHFEDKKRGFALSFEDARTVQDAAAAGLAAKTPVFTGAFFYSQGKDGYEQFAGTLPSGIEWSDTQATLTTKLGEPKFTITNKKTGALQALRWQIDGRMVSANFKSDGKLGHVYVGLN